MFTGIIEDIGKVLEIKKNGDKIFYISTKINYQSLKIGSSISCNGICLTIIKKGKKNKKNWFAISASKETLSRSNLSITKIGSILNLETSLKIGGELSGHLVFGHIDKKLKLKKIKNVGSSKLLVFEMPANLRKYIAHKGSISINGVSLTINNVSKNIFDVNVIPHTLKTTNFNKIKIGELFNIEVDMIARYVSNYLNFK